ncbi:MAG: hypothetical protein AB9834_07325 [Lentimicrobium sp.]
MKKIFYLLLVIITLQMSFDETLSHFDLSGHVDLKGNSTFASINFHLQKFHDHLWVVSAISELATCRGQLYSPSMIPVFYILPDCNFSIWQPPKSGQWNQFS